MEKLSYRIVPRFKGGFYAEYQNAWQKRLEEIGSYNSCWTRLERRSTFFGSRVDYFDSENQARKAIEADKAFWQKYEDDKRAKATFEAENPPIPV